MIDKAVEEQVILGEYAFEKGYISKKWKHAQAIWIKSNPTEGRQDVEEWSKRLVKLLHEYTYAMWNKRNKYLHTTNKKILRQDSMQRCYDRIDEIYSVDRSLLNNTERAIFKLPCVLRKKKGLESMSTWIAMAELTITNAYERNGRKLGGCMFTKSKIRKKFKNKKGTRLGII